MELPRTQRKEVGKGSRAAISVVSSEACETDEPLLDCGA
jgi:hypothetical protein